ncbi:MAG TPA: hypothetical protein VFA85_06580 [Terriglobales bacterium]|nr:hypothetical protein [Terriglobales bacterium]
MKLFILALLFAVISVLPSQAQSGPCTENAVKSGDLQPAADSFAYMPPYGKPKTGTSEIKKADEDNFSDRINIQQKWLPDHRIVSSPGADMAYEHGTLHMSSDSKSKPGAAGHEEFDAVMLIVYKAKGNVCQQVAMTMQPLEENSH